MRPVCIPDDGYRRGTAPVRRQAACRCGGIRGISNILMRNSFQASADHFEPEHLGLLSDLRHDVTRAFRRRVYFYLCVPFTHRISALSLSRSLTAHTQPHTTLQLLAPHTLTHSCCDVKGGPRMNAREARIHFCYQLSAIRCLECPALRAVRWCIHQGR
jgi:hypothetical protein